MYKKTLPKFRKFVSMFYPKNISKIITKVHSLTIESGRTSELIEIIEEKKYNTFLEVGVWQGDNVISIAKAFPNIKCYGVDPYAPNAYANYYKSEKSAHLSAAYFEDLYLKVLKKTTKFNNVEIIRTTSEQAVANFEDESIDIVFIDARHDYHSCKNDILMWLPKVKRGGVLSGHDYSLAFFGVVEAVNEIIGYDNVSIKSDSTWFYIKR